MLRLLNLFLVAILALGLISCSGSESTAVAKASPKTETQTKTVKKTQAKLSGKKPCDLLTKALVSTTFGVDQGILTQEPYGDTMCTYRWQKSNAEEIDKRNEEIMSEHFTKKMEALKQGKTLKRPNLENSSATVTLTLVQLKDASRAEASFAAMIKTAAEGFTGEHEGTKATFRIIYDQEIEGVGDQAAWSSKSKQLSLRSGGSFLHVLVDVHAEAEANLADAKKIAQQLLAK